MFSSPNSIGVTCEPDSDDRDSAQAREMRSSLKRGSVWALLGHGGSQFLRLAGNLVLWRLLFPDAFGLMAIVNVFMQGLAMFSDIGIGPSIIQNARGDDPDYLNTAWTIQAIRGGLLWLAALVLAIPIAHFYGEPQFASLIPVVALGSIISGFNSTRLATATRQIALGRLTVMELSSQASGLVVMVILSWLTRSLWSLVIGTLVSSLVRLALSHTYLPGIKNKFQWDTPSVHTLVRFGRWIFFSTLLGFAVMESDRLIFGKLIPMSLLGVYSIASVWSSFPASVLDRVFNSVLFPLLSRLNREQSSFFSASFISARKPWLIVAGWASACLISGGPTLITFLYDKRAFSGGWMIQILACSTWLLALETANSTALLALGKPSWVAIGSAAKLVGMVIFIPIGITLYGFPGALVGFAGSELLRYVASIVGAKTMKISGLWQDGTLSLLVAATAGAGWVTQLHIQHLLVPFAIHQPRMLAFIQLIGIGAAVGLAWGVYYLIIRVKARTVSTT